MKISNVRLGFATNSSSSHSIVIVPKDHKLDESYDSNNAVGEYGWEEFVLRSDIGKLQYLAVQVYYSLREQLGDEITKYVIESMFGEINIDYDLIGIDHQSQITFPVDQKTGYISLDFVKELKNYVLRNDVAILGGNDNEESPEDWKDLEKLKLFTDTTNAIRCVKSGDWWTLFNKYTGAKITLSLEDEPKELIRKRGPELVDLKITDWCPFECPFCYQESTKMGRISSLDNVRYILNALPKLGVFEVAIGGGEPTLYPYFIEVLEMANKVGLNVNFTTKVIPQKWHSDIREAVKKYVSGVAFSVANSGEINLLKEFRKETNIDVNAQFIVGAYSPYELKYLIKACNDNAIHLTLLGYKDVGLGDKYKEIQQDYLTVDLLKSAYSLSVDTAFLNKYHNLLKRANISDLLMVKKEGFSSMYIDAVEMIANVSSYSEKVPHKLAFHYDMEESLIDVWENLEYDK